MQKTVNHTTNTTVPTATQGRKMENPLVGHGISSEHKLAHCGSSPYSGGKRHDLRAGHKGEEWNEQSTGM